tara:strand:+ start:2688 stop:4793 length:2106 start_codon:yes stop_codon:yes gene_type:complete
MKKLKLAVFLAVILSSCVKDDYNLDSAKVQYSPEIAAPLLKYTIEASDLLTLLDSSMLTENSEQLLEYRYSDQVYSLALSEFINIDDVNFDFEFQLEPLSIEDIPPFQTAVSLQSVTDNDPVLSGLVTSLTAVDSCANAFPPVADIDIPDVTFPIAGAPFASATFSSGELSVELKNGWPTPINNVQLVLKNLSDNSVIGTLNYTEILPGDSLTDVIDLAGKTVESSMVGEFVTVSSAGTGGNPVCVSLHDEIVATVNGTNFVVVSGSAEFPNQEVINDTIDFAMDLTSGEQLETLELKSGNLAIEVDYEIEEAAKLYIELPYAKFGGNSFIDSIEIGGGPTLVNETFDLSGYSFDLSKEGQTVNAIEAIIRGSLVSSGTPVNFDTANSVTADITMSNIQPAFIDGYFGSQSLTLDPETFDFDLGEAQIFEKISFAEPTITLGFHNTFGIPMEISSLDLDMKRDDDSASLDASSVIPFQILSGNISSPDIPVTSELILGNSTNIAELINIWPNVVTTGFDGTINPQGNTYNYALDTSKMDITLDLSIPLYATVSEFTIQDTIEIDSSMSQGFEFVKRASLRTNIDNGFPLEASVKFYITDENYVILDSLESSDNSDVLINAAIVDPATGDVTSDGFRQADLTADEEDVNLLKISGNKLILSATLNTANSGANVKIYSFYKMEIKMGILAKIYYEADLDFSNN